MKIKFVKNAFGYKAEQEIEVTAEEAKAFGDAAVEVKAEVGDVVAQAADKLLADVDSKIDGLEKKFAKALSDRKPSIRVGRDNSDGDPTRGFKSYGEFLDTVRKGDEVRLKAAGLTGSVDADGGYALPPQYSQAILSGLANSNDNLIARTMNVNLTGDGRSMKFPVVKNYDRTSTNAAQVPVASWLAEGATKPTSKPQFEIVSLELKKIAAVLPATDEMISDFGALESILLQLGVDAINREVNAAIVRGDGNGKPTGIIGHASVVGVERGIAEDGHYLNVDDLANMYARFYGNLDSAVFLYHPALFPSLQSLTVGNNAVFLPAGGVSSAPYATLYGRPLIACEDCSAPGTAGDLILADMKKYATLTKGGIDIASSIHVRFLNDETMFRFVYRVDGKPVFTSPITPKHGTDTLSPFVMLEESGT